MGGGRCLSPLEVTFMIRPSRLWLASVIAALALTLTHVPVGAWASPMVIRGNRARGVVRGFKGGYATVILRQGSASVRDIFVLSRHGRELGDCMVVAVRKMTMTVVPFATCHSTPQTGDDVAFVRHAAPPGAATQPSCGGAMGSTTSAEGASHGSEAPTGGQSGEGWQAFVSTSQHYRCVLPGKPVERDISRQTMIGTFVYHLVVAHRATLFCEILSATLPGSFASLSGVAQVRELAFNVVVQGLEKSGMRVENRHPFTQAGYAGYEADVLVPMTRSPGKVRFLLVGSHVFLWVAVHGASGAGGASRFLDSFAPTP